MYKTDMYKADMCKAERPIQVRKLSHSELAMRAAKGMGRSRHKEKTGRMVCHHLLKMLESDGEHHDGGGSRHRNRSSDLHAHNQREHQPHAEQYSLHL